MLIKLLKSILMEWSKNASGGKSYDSIENTGKLFKSIVSSNRFIK